jgi:hypothetical protein
MQTKHALLSPDLTIDQAWQSIGTEASPQYLVGADSHLIGIVDFEDLEKARDAGKGSQLLWAVVDHDFRHVHPDQPIDVVLDRLAQSGGVLPVVARTDAHHLEGVITPDGLLKRTERTGDSQPIASDTRRR